MKTLLRKIKDDLFAAGITNKELAVYLGTTEKQTSNYLNGNTQFTFHCFSNMLIKIYGTNPELRRDCLIKYCEHIKGNKNLKIGMEYTHARGEFHLLKKLIDKANKSKKEELKEWAIVYDILYRRSVDGLIGKKLIKEVNEVRTSIKQIEMKLLLEIIYCYGLYDTKNFRYLHPYALDVKKKIIKNIPKKNNFIRQSFSIKINESIHVSMLALGKINRARYYGRCLLAYLGVPEKYPIPQASALYVLGESYIFEDYNMSKMYLENAIRTLEYPFNDAMNTKKMFIINTLNFLKIYHGKELDIINPSDLAEKAFLEIRKGNKEYAIKILKELEQRNGKLSAFQLFYLGLAKNDRKLIEKSLKKFEEMGDIFYAQLPKIYLGIM